MNQRRTLRPVRARRLRQRLAAERGLDLRSGRIRAFALGVAAATVLGVLSIANLGGPAGAAAPGSPTGSLEKTLGRPGGLTFSGWALDPDKPSLSVAVYLTVDGAKSTANGATVTANGQRPDLARSHPAAVSHGFAMSVAIPSGRHTVCVSARNLLNTRGADLQLACTTRTFVYGPVGQIQSFRTMPGAIHLAGWVFDSDVPTTPLNVRITVDGVTRTITAGRVNAEAAKQHPYAGNRHGFATTMAVSQGAHQVCITGVNVGYGSDTTLRCGTLTLSESPVGVIDTVQQNAGKLQVRGWTYDPDAAATALSVTITVDGKSFTSTANGARDDVAAAHRTAGKYHGFDVRLTLPEGAKHVCVTARNISFGSNTVLGCRDATLNFTPTAAVTALTATPTGLSVTGWATDPDTSRGIHVRISLNGAIQPILVANRAGGTHPGHAFTATYTLHSGRQTVCAVAINSVYGTRNSPAVCRTITLALGPIGRFEKLARAANSTDLIATGWAFDPDTATSRQVAYTLDGRPAGTYTTKVARSDVSRLYPSAGAAAHGFAQRITANDGEHTLCVVARNYGGGADRSLGCKVINAVHPVAPSAPRAVVATAGFGGATLTWQAPASDGGAPWSGYTVTALTAAGTRAGGTTTGAGTTSATIYGLKSNSVYTFTVTATNVAGASAAGTSQAVKTQATPPAQRTPAPVSTSRYIRNIRGSGAADLATMRAEGVADAKANPSGHGYLVLLDIGGQDQEYGGVILSATTRFVSYSDLVTAVNAYVDGYASQQKLSAPVTIAIGTNNDVDVSSSSGRAWADLVIDPIRSYTRKYSGISVAGANDIEPGFRASYSQTKAWLSGYLAATSAPFVFNGSADGCAYTVSGRSCNNGWTMAGLYYLSAGAAPTRSLNLPQVYNTTMAAQWKYISLTGVDAGSPRINFGGPLTEYTACVQTNNSCGSLSGRTAWSAMWNNLQSDSRLKVSSLPYSTDLRIDR